MKYFRQQNKKKLKIQNLSRSLYYLYFVVFLGIQRVFLGIPGYSWVFFGILGYSLVFFGILGYSWVNVCSQRQTLHGKLKIKRVRTNRIYVKICNMNNTNPTKYQGLNQILRKGQCKRTFIPPCVYSGQTIFTRYYCM